MSVRAYIRYFYDLVGIRFYLAILMSTLLGLLDGLGIGFSLGMLQYLFSPESIETINRNNHFDTLLKFFTIDNLSVRSLLIIIFIIYLVKALIYYIQNRIQGSVNQSVMSQTRLKLVKALTEQKYAGFLDTDSGTVHNISTSEVFRLSYALQSFINSAQCVIIAVTYILIALTVNPVFACIVLGLVIVLLLLYRLLTRRIKHFSKAISLIGNKYAGYLSQYLQNFKYLKATDGVAKYKEKIEEEIIAAESRALKIWNIQIITSSLREPVIILIIVLIVFINYRVSGQFNAFGLFTLLLFYRAVSFSLMAQNYWQTFHNHAGSIANVNDLLQAVQNRKEESGSLDFKGFKQNIELKDIYLSLNQQTIINGISLVIPNGSVNAFIGANGAGKTTLATLISGLHSPDNGSVYVDGVDLRQYNINSYRNHIGYVTQDPVIFNDSIINNIILWQPKTEDVLLRFQEVIKAAQLEDFLKSVNEGAETICGDNGIALSGGQKQRIALARELFRKIEILLLDEVTSSIDANTELLLQEQIENLRHKCTVIIIAHKLNTIKQADQIFILDKGKIIDSGRFEELATRSDYLRNY